MTTSDPADKIKHTARRHGAFIIMAACWLCAQLYFLPDKYLWHDEFLSILSANGRTGEIGDFLNSKDIVETSGGELLDFLEPAPGGSLAAFLENQGTRDIHPPAFFFLLRWWMEMGARSAAALALLPLLISLFCLVLLYLLAGRLLHPPHHLLVPGLWMISIPCWETAPELRQYGLLLACSAALTILVTDAGRDPELLASRPRRLLIGAVTALGMLTQYMFLWLAIALNAWLLLCPGMRAKKSLLRWFSANLPGVFIFALWVPWVFTQFSSQAERNILPVTLSEAIHSMIEVALHFVVSPPALWSIPALLVLALLALGFYKEPFPGFRRLFALVVIFCLALPTLLLWSGVMNIAHLFRVKYFLPAVPVFLLVLARGTAAWKNRLFAALSAALLCALVVINLLTFIAYDRGCRVSETPKPCAYFPVLVKFIEQRAPAGFVTVIDGRRAGNALEIASMSSPERTILIGDCRTLPETLPAWAESNQPRTSSSCTKSRPAAPGGSRTAPGRWQRPCATTRCPPGRERSETGKAPTSGAKSRSA